MRLFVLITLVAALLAGEVRAAASVQPITPAKTSVRGGERQVYEARFFDAFGRPAVGESVRFANDACGSFENGAVAIEKVTDATGFASATFTARNQGITCWVSATAGVTVRFDVFTYTPGQVSVTASITPAQPRPGRPFTVIAAAHAGAYPIYEAQISAAVVPAGGGARIIPSSLGSGQEGRVAFDVSPQLPLGDFVVEVSFRGVTKRIPVAAPASPLQDMWWGGPAENGWGISLVQHGERLFGVIYAYDAEGRATWYVMPGGAWDANGEVFAGALYAPRGAPWSAYDASRLQAGDPVGEARIAFDGLDRATLDVALGAVRAQKSLTRQPFGPLVDSAAPRVVDDMWWGGPAQNGWGLAVLQQHRSLFVVWFTYDEAGLPTWFVMPSGFWRDASTWEGRIFRAGGPPWPGAPYDPGALRHAEAGGFQLRFDGARAAFAFTIDGRPGTLELERQPF